MAGTKGVAEGTVSGLARDVDVDVGEKHGETEEKRQREKGGCGADGPTPG